MTYEVGFGQVLPSGGRMDRPKRHEPTSKPHANTHIQASSTMRKLDSGDRSSGEQKRPVKIQVNDISRRGTKIKEARKQSKPARRPHQIADRRHCAALAVAGDAASHMRLSHDNCGDQLELRLWEHEVPGKSLSVAGECRSATRHNGIARKMTWLSLV
jgi:hypothetical protein